ncbi:aldehyde ferredoxin oxidoreductase family protein [Desulfocicer niacini]
MKGWIGKILRVDLTTGVLEDELLDPKVVKDYIGGRGIGIYYLNKEMDPTCDPFSPENLMVMMTGPLTGTGAPTGARYMVMTKSPLTGAVTCSNSGGMMPREIKRAGYDGVIFKGKSEKPVFLWINNGKAQLKSAEHIWGKNVPESTDMLLSETDPKARVACIGPAGENKVLFAGIMNEKHRAAGRSGVGAVMGSKNLKGVVVLGNNKIELAHPDAFKEFNQEILKQYTDEAKITPVGLTINGTSGVVAVTQSKGILPTKNWQQGTFDGWEDIQGTTLTEKYLVKNQGCFGCPIKCARITKVTEPGFEGEGEGPEYETVYAMGSNCMINNLAAITKANYLCNELGLDTITMGATVACAMELVDRGYVSEDEVGRSLKWGDGEALVELTRQTAYREGFGNKLADGSYRLADGFGHPELAMVSKKQEFPGYEPRGAKAMGLAYATSPIGGSHMRGDPAYFEIFGTTFSMDPLVTEGKAAPTKCIQDLSAIVDAAGLCIFFGARMLAEKNNTMSPTGMLTYLNTATGADYTIEELNLAAARITNAERMFLVKAGFDRKDDSLPKRITDEPLPGGPAKGQTCDLQAMLDDYYKVQGWDNNGIPTVETLEKLGLGCF